MSGGFSPNMFVPMRSFGSTIGLPFLSQTEDKQLSFRAGKNGIKRLYGSEVIPLTDYGYWSQFYLLFDSAADVQSLVTVQDIRSTLQCQPKNLRSLILTLSHHLFTLLPSDLFPSPTPSSSSIIRSQLAGQVSQQNPTKEALNCLRVLGRVLAVVYEIEADDMPSRSTTPVQGEHTPSDADLRRDFAWQVLWRRMQAPKPQEENRTSNGSAHVAGNEAEQFELGDHSDGEEDSTAKEWKDAPSQGAPAAPTSTRVQPATDDPLTKQIAEVIITEPSGETDNTLPSLADRLFSCTVDLLFCAGFTIPDGVRTGEHSGDKINYVIWERGVGSTVNIGSSADLDRHKTEVMRFLLILLSSTIYTPPHRLPYSTNRPLRYLTHSLERRLVLSLLCSWLNTSLASSPASIGEQLPYNHLVFKLGEDRRNLVKMSLTCLLVALDFQSSSGEEAADTPGLGEASTPSSNSESNPQALRKDGNAFRYFVSKLHRKDDFAFILNGILSVLADFTAVTNNLLPGSKKPVPYILEIFMLFWKLIDLNKRFRAYITESGKIVDIVGYILLCCLELKDNPAHHGLLRMLSYILQTLSSDKDFAIALNQPQRLTFPVKWAVQGTTGDLLIVSMYSIATTSNLNPLFQPLTITVANVAPYLKGIGVQASTRLLQLFKAFSAPHFLLADEGHPRLVYYLLETFNGVLYHQLDENPNLVYSILRAHQDFQSLATFTLASGLREVQRRLMVKATAAAAGKKDDRLWDNNLSAEKAALLARDDETTQELDLSTPSSPAGRRTSRSLTTNPLHTPSEAEEDPLASPQANAEKQYAAPKSEKAKGKMRERADSSSTLGVSVELEKLAAAGIGPSGYVPTQEWVSSWQKGLPLDPVLIAVSELLPRVQELQTASSPAPSRAVFNYLRSASLADVLPKVPPHSPRKFQWSVASSIWLTSLLWGDIYVSMLSNFNGTHVKLFGVKQAGPSRREQAIQNVSNRLLSFVGSSGKAQETSFTV